MQGTSRRVVVGLIVTSLIVAVAAALFALSRPPQYVATSTLLVGPVTSDVDTLRAAQSLTNTDSQLLVSPTALRDAARRGGMSAAAGHDARSVTFNVDTRIVVLKVTTDTAQKSRTIASSLVTDLTRTVGTVDPTAPGALRVLTAQPQTAVKVARSVLRYAVLGGVGWLILGIAVLAAFAATPAGSSRSAGSRSRRDADLDGGARGSDRDQDQFGDQRHAHDAEADLARRGDDGPALAR